MPSVREKRLIALMNKGCYIYNADGHRWLAYTDHVDYNLNEILKKNKISLNDKCYGGIDELLNNIDSCLEMCGRETLEKWYDDHIDQDWDVEYISNNYKDRISKVMEGGIY